MPQYLSSSLLIVLLGIGGCTSDHLSHVKTLKPNEIEERMDIYSELEEMSKRSHDRFIWIDAKDIEQPPTSASDEPTDAREYDFYVRVDTSDLAMEDRAIDDLMRSGEIEIDVIGARARLTPVTYPRGTDGKLPGDLSTARADPIESSGVTLDGLSSSMIEPVPVPRPRNALTVLLSFTVNLSCGSTTLSPLMPIMTTAETPPAGMFTVPDFAT